MENDFYICLICGEKIKKDKTFSKIYSHIKNKHNLSSIEYKIKFNLGKGLKKYIKCSKCENFILEDSKSGMCKKCNDKYGRFGKNNPFYGKTHSKETMNIIKKKNSIAFKEKWKNEEYRNKVIKGTSKQRSKIGKQHISDGVKKSYIFFPELKKLRSNIMKQRIDNGYDPTHRKLKENFHSINSGYGFSGFHNNIFYASKLELKRMLFFDENNILYNRYDLKKMGNIYYFDKELNNKRTYFPDIVIENYIEEIKYENNITELVIKKYCAAFNYLKEKNIKYYIVSLKEIKLLPIDAFNSALNTKIREQNNLFFN